MSFDDELTECKYEEVLINNKKYFIHLDCINDEHYKMYLCYKILNDINESDSFEAETVPNYTANGKEVSLANELDWFLTNYIKFQINEIYYKYLRTTIDELGQNVFEKYPAIIKAFPDELTNEKQYLLKLCTIRDNLQSCCGKGGGFEIIQWLIDESKSGVFQFLLGWALSNGISSVIQFLKDFRTDKHVKVILKSHKQDLEEIMKYPNNEFKSEDAISSFIEEKTNNYREQIIEIIKKHNKKEIK